MNNTELIVMLTHDDYTVQNAREVFEQCKKSKARYWGMKDHSLPLSEMQAIYTEMKRCGMTTLLEVVDYTEEGGMAGVEVAAACGCDILLGTTYSDTINDYCRKCGIRYMPFVGRVSGRPSVLEGNVAEMISEAQQYISKGVYGIDLLGYRYVGGDSHAISAEIVRAVGAPVCLAGSIDSYDRLDEVRDMSPWAFTIGSAFFDQKFGSNMTSQIDMVCDYMAREDFRRK